MVVPGSHGCLPDLTLLQLTVAQHGIDPVVLLVYLTGQRHTHSGGNALTETAGGHIYTGHMAHFRVTGEMPVDAAEGGKHFPGEKAPHCQNGIQCRRTVSLAQYEAVPVRVIRLGGVDPHGVKIQNRKNLAQGHGPAQMAGCGPIHHFKRASAGLCAQQRKLRGFFYLHTHIRPFLETVFFSRPDTPQQRRYPPTDPGPGRKWPPCLPA